MALALLIFLSCESEKIESPIPDSETSSLKIDKISTSKTDMNRGDGCELTFEFSGSALDPATNLPWTDAAGNNVFQFKWSFDPILCTTQTTYEVWIEFRTDPTLVCEGNPGDVVSNGVKFTNVGYVGDQEYFYNPIGDVIQDKVFQYQTVVILKHCPALYIICTYTTTWEDNDPMCSYMWE